MNRRMLEKIAGLLVLIGVAGFGIYKIVFSGFIFVSSPAEENTVVVPPIEGMENWKTYDSNNMSFRYPDDFGTTYIHYTTWPPVVRLSEEPYTCRVGESAGTPARVTEKRVIYKHEYCRTIGVGSGAGSAYEEYTYLTKQSGKVVSVHFTLQKPQCANYDEVKKNECEHEQETFDIDSIIDRIFRTIEFH